jgi:hypothetical protein
MMKKRGHLGLTWAEKFFVLDGSVLDYYDEETHYQEGNHKHG